MNEHDLYLKWSTGSMVIHMDEFFPCSKKDFVFLLKKVINLDYDWERHSAVLEKLKVYLQERIKRLPNEAEQKKQLAADYEKKMLEMKKAISRAEKGGADRMKTRKLRNEYDINRAYMQEAKANARKLANSKPKFEEYLEILEAERQRW